MAKSFLCFRSTPASCFARQLERTRPNTLWTSTNIQGTCMSLDARATKPMLRKEMRWWLGSNTPFKSRKQMRISSGRLRLCTIQCSGYIMMIMKTLLVTFCHFYKMLTTMPISMAMSIFKIMLMFHMEINLSMMINRTMIAASAQSSGSQKMGQRKTRGTTMSIRVRASISLPSGLLEKQLTLSASLSTRKLMGTSNTERMPTKALL